MSGGIQLKRGYVTGEPPDVRKNHNSYYLHPSLSSIAFHQPPDNRTTDQSNVNVGLTLSQAFTHNKVATARQHGICPDDLIGVARPDRFELKETRSKLVQALQNVSPPSAFSFWKNRLSKYFPDKKCYSTETLDSLTDEEMQLTLDILSHETESSRLRDISLTNELKRILTLPAKERNRHLRNLKKSLYARRTEIDAFFQELQHRNEYPLAIRIYDAQGLEREGKVLSYDPETSSVVYEESDELNTTFRVIPTGDCYAIMTTETRQRLAFTQPIVWDQEIREYRYHNDWQTKEIVEHASGGKILRVKSRIPLGSIQDHFRALFDMRAQVVTFGILRKIGFAYDPKTELLDIPDLDVINHLTAPYFSQRFVRSPFRYETPELLYARKIVKGEIPFGEGAASNHEYEGHLINWLVILSQPLLYKVLAGKLEFWLNCLDDPILSKNPFFRWFATQNIHNLLIELDNVQIMKHIAQLEDFKSDPLIFTAYDGQSAQQLAKSIQAKAEEGSLQISLNPSKTKWIPVPSSNEAEIKALSKIAERSSVESVTPTEHVTFVGQSKKFVFRSVGNAILRWFYSWFF